MSKIVPTPAMPMGAKFDPDETLLTNAASAWEYEKTRVRRQMEHNARVLARRVFRTDELEFSYDVLIGLDVPTFEIESELCVYNGSKFSLIEFCSECGKQPKGREFGSLAGFGRAIEERDESDAHVCRMCQATASVKK